MRKNAAIKVLWPVLGLALHHLAVNHAAHACLQDRDTLETEARGVPDVIQAVSGRFPRNPPLFYKLRLQRVVGQLKTDPSRLDLYDDAAVACDRISRSDEALTWIEKKRALLETRDARDPKIREHWYRYWANVGTFRAHRWLRNGADRRRIAEMKQARDEIRRAIRIKPDAHFGREKYQLKAMEWIVAAPKIQNAQVPDFLKLQEVIYEYPSNDELKQRGYGDATRGLTGLIILGNAWESVDVYYALKNVMHAERQSTLAYLCGLRLQELIRDGRSSLHPQAPKGAQLVSSIVLSDPMLEPEGTKPPELGRTFRRLRDEADQWHARRTAYMMARLETGHHPDEDARFWDDWRDDGPPPLSETSLWQQSQLPLGAVAILAFSSLFSLWIVKVARRRTAAKVL